MKPLNELQEWSKNPRSINNDAFARLKDQIELKGQYKPLLITPSDTFTNEQYNQEYIVLGGNMRLKIFKELGVQEVWVTIIDFIEQEGLWHAVVNGQTQKETYQTKEDGMMAYSLSDNDRAGYYDAELMANIMPEFNLDWSQYAVDFDAPETLTDFVAGVIGTPDVVEDEAPAVDAQNPPVSQLGEVYQLGSHRLMCGDSTTVRDVSVLMGASLADMVFTDPPYGYSYKSNHQEAHEMLKNDDVILPFLSVAYDFARDNTPFYTFCGWQTVDKWMQEVKVAQLNLKNIIIWKKNNWSMGDLEGAYAGQYEMILYSTKGRVLIDGERDRDIWEFNRALPTDHPTTKPIDLCAKAINNHDAKLILDLFGGSGSTLIAAEQLGRVCYMMELDPKYCDVIRKRYSKFYKKEEIWQEYTPKIAEAVPIVENIVPAIA